MGADAVEMEEVLGHSFPLDDDAVVQEARFHIESHDSASGLFQVVFGGAGIGVARFFIAGENDFDGVPVIAIFSEQLRHVEEDGHASFHVESPGTGDPVSVHMEGPLFSGAFHEDRVHVAGEDDKGLHHISVFRHQHISCLFIGMEMDGEAGVFQERCRLFSYGIYAVLIVGPAVPVHQFPPGVHHGRLPGLYVFEKFFGFFHFVNSHFSRVCFSTMSLFSSKPVPGRSGSWIMAWESM